ncbi:L-2-hydroxyglutarate oxidase [bacterium]|nr:L-2-hydroxyglutarate oxidase [bacterium]
MIYHAIIIGAGVVGCAVARALAARRSAWKILVLEKEPDVAMHTSGRNSGVIHSGFNSAPGSLKARFCVEGSRRLRAYAVEHGVAMQEVGTVVVALDSGDESVLRDLEQRGRENGVPGICLIDRDRLRQIEPHALGVSALHSPAGAIVDSAGIVHALAADARDAGVEFGFFKRVRKISRKNGHFRVSTDTDRHEGVRIINCAGLYSDKIARSLGACRDYAIFPFRGDYFQLSPSRSTLVRSMIYPAPNLKYPFLGIHFTRKVTGEVLAGPNAVLAAGRESYEMTQVHLGETMSMALDPRFWKLVVGREFRTMAWEQIQTTFFKKAFVSRARRIIPDLRAEDFSRGQSGIRAQLVDRSGHLVEDLVIERQDRAIHVLNAVSPGLTCSLPFADHVVDELLKQE